MPPRTACGARYAPTGALGKTCSSLSLSHLRQMGICLSNIAHGPEGQRETVEKEGAQEALEEAVHDCDGLNTMSLNSLVNAMDESQVRPLPCACGVVVLGE